jgi:Ca-activated chloride channel homolog
MDRVPEQLLVGYVGYSSAPEIVEEPTLEHERIRAAIASLIADGATATGDALTSALDRLEARKGKDGQTAPAAIVLLSDGKTTEGSDPLVAARRASRLKIPIYTVALGTEDGTVSGGPFSPPIPVPPDPETLREIAQISGGAAYEVDDSGQLDRIYERLGSRIGTKRERREITSGFAGAGLVLLAAGLMAGLRRRSQLA